MMQSLTFADLEESKEWPKNHTNRRTTKSIRTAMRVSYGQNAYSIHNREVGFL